MAQADATTLELLEFWPDYGHGPLWWRRGTPADLDALGLPGDLTQRLKMFNDAYEEQRLPVNGAGDAASLTAGGHLLFEVREALAGRFRVVVTEPWWGEPPLDYER